MGLPRIHITFTQTIINFCALVAYMYGLPCAYKYIVGKYSSECFMKFQSHIHVSSSIV